MARRMPIDERDPAHYSAPAMPPARWDAPHHAGPSRFPLDPRGVPEYDWSSHARVPQHTGMVGPSPAWPAHAHDLPRPTEFYSHAHSVGDMRAAAATIAAPAPILHNRRASDEEWQRYQHQSSMTMVAPIPPVASSTYHAHLGHEAPSLREAVPVTSPVQSHPPAMASTGADPEPPRARVACSFCRVRKLRCDGATPCRHCERRSIDCIYAPSKTKVKAAGRTSPDKGSNAATSLEPTKPNDPEQAHASNTSRDRGVKRPELPQSFKDKEGRSSTETSRSSDSSKRIKIASDSSNHSSPGRGSDPNRESNSSTSSTPSSSMPGSDLAMIQNNTSPIPMEPTLGDHDDWWTQLLGTFGRTRSTSTRIVQHLLTRFVQSNAVFFGLLHAPTLLSVVSGSQGRARADPALYLAVLAVSACDMHQTRISDERTSDMRSANEASRKLASRLSQMAADYLQTSTAHGAALTPSLGQAASILALTQPDGSMEQNSLIRLAENVVRTLRLHETVSSREPLLQDSEPDSPLYWSRPLASDTPESEVKYESIVRLCWTGISHRFRKYIAQPDQDFGEVDLPEFIHGIRPMAFWQPSLLPDDLPPPFFHSQDLMRKSARLSRLTVSLAQLEKMQEVDGSNTPSAETLEKVRGCLAALDELEHAFVRHQPRTEAERHNVHGRTVQMFCRMHVWVRLTIWRKYNLWTSPSEVASGAELFPQHHHPTVDFWLTIVQDMIDTMQHDLDAHVSDHTALRTTVSDIDTLARHAICACDLVAASRRAQPISAQLDAALTILKRVLAYAALSDAAGGGAGLHVPADVVRRVRSAEARRVAVRAVDMAQARQPRVEVGGSDIAVRAA
ncbi:hypothetical protein EX895_000702 [Sporisorium graminicola]|uniref:Zn(2)-C6 fungal-type domain-containing protein n=1 Tax=Sporisorium graminicola TaxID=280036 RepID=A0A4U7L0H2_9BASI|nr:hypothetical protein EX895_000702 [Sporisorium graminicola]TKY90704.1 hypothetical protein EX895_000702 [Sporisorium graminicola]